MISIYTFVVSPFMQNARIFIDEETQEALIIDPGHDVERIFSLIEEKKIKSSRLFLTHCHIDHAGGVVPLLRLYQNAGLDAPSILCHRNELPVGAFIEQYALMSGFPEGIYYNLPHIDVYLEDYDEICFGKAKGRCLFTPGHSPGHMALFFDAMEVSFFGDVNLSQLICQPILLSGDTLFYESIGRTDLPGGDSHQLMVSIQEKICILPPSTVVLSGHGQDTTIAHELEFNPFLKSV